MTRIDTPHDVRALTRTARLTLRARLILRARLAAVPSVGSVLAIYLGSRVLTTGILGLFYALAPAFGWSYGDYTARPSFIQFMTSWDGKFYERVALQGYPVQLPFDSHGHVEPNAWAFLPVYPWLTRGLMTLTGLDFAAAGVILSTLFGAIAVVLLHKILAPRLGARRALWPVLFFCLGPMSFVLQITYAESLFLVLMFASLLAFTARRYLLMIPFGVVAAFTHPSALALSAAIGFVFLASLIRRERVPLSQRLRMILAAAVIAAAGFAWPVIAGAVTGYQSAYFETELSWWTGYVGRTHFIPFTPWFTMANRFLGDAGAVLVIAVVGFFVWWLTRRGMRVLGGELLAFSGSYAAYLFAVFLPQQSLVRLVLPLAPLLGTPVLTDRPAVRRIFIVLLIASQPVVIALLWFLGPP